MLQALTLRFDGSYRGGCGGCGAVLLSQPAQRVVWQGAKFLSHCPGSAHAEYEGLVLGLEAAAASGFTSFSLDIEGDCRVVLSQAAGRSRSRKLSKLHSRAKACLEQMPLNGRPSYGSIPRDENEHADALSRAAVDAAQALHSGAILATIRSGDFQLALQRLDMAQRSRVPLRSSLFDEFISACDRDQEWQTLLQVYNVASNGGRQRSSPRAVGYAIHALESIGATSRGSGYDSRRLVELRRLQREIARPRRSTRTGTVSEPGVTVAPTLAAMPAGTISHAAESAIHSWRSEHQLNRGTAANLWCDLLVEEAGGSDAIMGAGGDSDGAPRLLQLASRLETHGIGY